MQIYEGENFDDAHFDIYDLHAVTGIPARTVHYYVQQGIIPKAVGSGPAARYSYVHAIRLNVMTILKTKGLTLWEIKAFLDGHTIRELYSFANGRDPQGAVYRLGRFIHRANGRPPRGILARFRVRPQFELYVGDRYLARVAVRFEELEKAIDKIIGLDDDLE
jgi:DNA-binding transcriptional MerR regulator